MRTFAILVLTILINASLAQSQSMQVRGQEVETQPGEAGSVGFYGDANSALLGLRIPLQIENTSIVIDSVKFLPVVDNGQYTLDCQISDSRRRGFVQVLPKLSSVPFYLYNEEVFRIYYTIKPDANEAVIVIDTFYNRIRVGNLWIAEEIEASDDLGTTIRPSFSPARIAIPLPIDTTHHEPPLPDGYSLEQNHPNPFNLSTTINFSLPYEDFVVLEVFDLLGRRIDVLLERVMSAGDHRVEWNPVGRGSGHYYYRLSYSGGSIERKMTLLK